MEAVLTEQDTINEYFYMKHNRSLIKLSVHDISYVKVEGRYSEIYHTDRRFVCRKPLTDLVLMLPSELFVRSHRNYLINKNYVDKVIFGEGSVYLTNGEALPVSKRYLNAVRGMFPIVS